MDKTLIYALFQQFNIRLSNCQLFNRWDFIDLLEVANQKATKAIDNARIYLCLWQDYSVFSPHLFPPFDHFGVFLL